MEVVLTADAAGILKHSCVLGSSSHTHIHTHIHKHVFNICSHCLTTKLFLCTFIPPMYLLQSVTGGFDPIAHKVRIKFQIVLDIHCIFKKYSYFDGLKKASNFLIKVRKR